MDANATDKRGLGDAYSGPCVKLMRNLFCDTSDLHNEADVEALFVEPLLQKLGYPNNRIRRKASLEELRLPTTGVHGDLYRPDYVLMDSTGRPVAIADAKSPQADPSAYRYQVTGYALLINQRHDDNPVQFCMLSNGLQTEVLRWDSSKPVLALRHSDFESGNMAFAELRSTLGYSSFNQQVAVKQVRPDFKRPTIDEIIGIFAKAHDIIWKKEKIAPTKAFYELAKLLFVKLRQDKDVVKKIDRGESLADSDFHFSARWIAQNEQLSSNPVSDILFGRIQKRLEQEIREGNKKRIFLQNERIQLKPSTIVEVVRLLENHDLHGIDEDLNGRMFETFLNATVRGRALGQYFTPRPVVKYMTKSARLRLHNDSLPRVIDACCGSGGFLIEALALLAGEIDQAGQLTNIEKGILHQKLQHETLFGVEANDEIGRVARLNMYLHGDGGSRIYIADTLDKDLRGERGEDEERLNQLSELRKEILDNELRFDVALTNPPFSMSYSRKDPAEQRILSQYEIASGSSTHSNVLFMERYRDLLTDKGELLTVIDDTILNGVNFKYVRDFLRKNFIIRQVISLPFNAFLRAEAGCKTTILHLRRRQIGESQGEVFMAILNNVGHDDYKNDTPHRDNLPEVAVRFSEWIADGTAPDLIRANDGSEALACPMQVFVVPGNSLSDRIDANYYAPELHSMRSRFQELESKNTIDIKSGRDFHVLPKMSGANVRAMYGRVARYIEIGNITKNGLITDFQEARFEALPTRARIQLQAGDVLFAKNISSRGIALIVPQWMDGGFASTGFIAIRPRGREEGLILWSIFRSEIWRKQIYYLAITATQPEIREHIFKEDMQIPWPADIALRSEIIGSAKNLLRAQEQATDAALVNQMAIENKLLD